MFKKHLKIHCVNLIGPDSLYARSDAKVGLRVEVLLPMLYMIQCILGHACADTVSTWSLRSDGHRDTQERS